MLISVSSSMDIFKLAEILRENIYEPGQNKVVEYVAGIVPPDNLTIWAVLEKTRLGKKGKKIWCGYLKGRT